MLNSDYIIKGEKRICDIPEDCFLGTYFVERLKQRSADDVIAIDGITGSELTCGQLLDEIFKMVMFLTEVGVERGDVVSLISENSLKCFAPVFAVSYIGAVGNFINHVYTAGELQRVFSITKPKVIITSKSAYRNISFMEDCSNLSKTIVLLDKIPKHETIKDVETVFLPNILQDLKINKDKIPPPNFVDQNDVCAMLLSSGTTGLPKCAMITYKNFIYALDHFTNSNTIGIPFMGTTAIAVLPFCHIYGGTLVRLVALQLVKVIVLPSFSPETYLKCIQKYKVSVIWAVPTLILFLTNPQIQNEYDLSSIKYVTCAGGFLSIEIYKKFLAMYPHANIIQLYGLTEVCGSTIIHPGNNLTKLGSIGQLSPNVEAMVWDVDIGNNVGPFEIGEICFRGPTVMKGYLSENIMDQDKNGFYRSGDLGYYDEDDYFYLVGRSKEMIKYKGFQVAPVEIEEILLKHEAISDCAVIGIADERAGELPRAFVVLQPDSKITEEAIVKHVAENISIHKQLHGGVKFIASIPRNTLGKVEKAELLKIKN